MSFRHVHEPILPLETETERTIRLRIDARRTRSEDRKEHYLEPNTLKFPVIPSEIEKQLAEKEIKRQAEILAEQRYAEEKKRLQATMAKIELDRENDRKARLIELREYQDKQVKSRPPPEKKEPIRKSDYDTNLGISSGQIFQGEDLSKPERRRLQHLQMRQWVAEEKEILEEKKRKEREEEMEYARSVDRHVAYAKQLEQDRKQYDYQKYMETLHANQMLDVSKKDRDHHEKEYLRDFPPLEQASSMSFIREERTNPHPMEYRGMSQEELEQIKEQQISQIKENEAKREKERQDERDWVRIHENNILYANQQAYLDELEKFKAKQQALAYNENLRKLKLERDRREKDYLGNTRPTSDFFQYFDETDFYISFSNNYSPLF